MRSPALWLLSIAPLAAQSPCILEGTVTESLTGKPVAAAKIYAHPSSSDPSYLRKTDNEGKFCFEQVAPGTYHVIAQRLGYLDQSYGARAAGEEGMDLAVTAETAVPPLKIELTPRPILSGVVLHADGQPSPGTDVEVIKRVHTEQGPGPDSVENVSTDDRGAFRFSNLAPGTYYLSAQPDSNGRRYSMEFLNSRGEPVNEAETVTFYSGASAFAGARPIVLKAGQETSGIVIALRKTPLRRISGRVTGMPKDTLIELSPQSDGLTNVEMRLEPDGSFKHAGILPGKYVLEVPSMDGSGPRIHQEVDLTTADAENLALEPRETFTVPLVMKSDSGNSLGLAETGIILNAIPQGQGIGAGTLDNGGIGFPHVAPGIYSIQLNDLFDRRRYYLKRVTINGEPQSPRRLDLHAPPSSPLELTFSPGLAEIEGRVSDKPAVAVTVLLVRPEEERDGEGYAQRESTDQDGKFHIESVEPGKYRLYAIEGFEDGPWGSEGLAEALHSVGVELREKETREITVPLVRAAEWNAAVERFGK